MMKGYRSVENWEPLSKILENVHTVYEEYLEHANGLKKIDTPDSSAFNMYLRVLGKAGLFQKMFDVFNQMHDEGPFIPQGRTYVEMLVELSDRRTIPGLGPLQVVQKNASDARYLWKIYSKDVEEGRVTPDVQAINIFLRALVYGTPSDNLVAFDIIREYIGLSKPGEEPLKPRVLVNGPLLSTVFDVALAARRPKAAIHFLQQVIDQPVPEGTTRPITSGHIGQVLYAYTELASRGSFGESQHALNIIEWTLRASIEDPSYVDIAPDIRVYRNAFCCFWRSSDWPSAIRAFELMTGYSISAFQDGASSPPRNARSRQKIITPDRVILSWLARIALATQDPANMRVCLRILDHYSVSDTFRRDEKRLPMALTDNMEILTKKMAFWDLKLAEVCVNLVDHTLLHEARADSKARYTSEELDRWRALQSIAAATVKWYRTHPKFPASYVPHEEMEVLGSARGLSAMEKVIERSIDHRYSKSI
jgi:pentatricopeptide repeat protein